MGCGPPRLGTGLSKDERSLLLLDDQNVARTRSSKLTLVGDSLEHLLNDISIRSPDIRGIFKPGQTGVRNSVSDFHSRFTKVVRMTLTRHSC